MKRTALWRRLIETRYGSMWEGGGGGGGGGGAGVLVVCRGLTGLVGYVQHQHLTNSARLRPTSTSYNHCL